MLDDSRIVYASYTYDENGIRTSKECYGETTKFIYDGDKLLAEYTVTNSTGTAWHCKEYLYDGNDEMVGYKCDNNVFFFLKDAEGDVIGLVDSSNGNVVEKYSYDPWGAVTGANANSQRYNSIYYRGYYYDIDDSRYYLQSRYYKPQWGSFINADLPEIAQQSKNEVNGLNLFTYCNNDPVNNVDPTGNDAFTIFGLGLAVESVVIPILLISLLIYVVVSGLTAVSIPAISISNITISSNTKSLPDVKAEKRSGKKEYQFCYLKGNKIIRVGKKMTWKTALIAMGITNTSTNFRIKRTIDLGSINSTANDAKNNSSSSPWGIFADSQVAAKTLAYALGYTKKPEVHQSGYYGHYHDGKHKIHIWYGKQVWY